MNKESLGRLEKVSPRTYWEHEDTEFTPWLAQEENIALLGDTIGIELEVQEQEAAVGPFRADILCRNTANGSLVLIENQLERTDHTHLGQLFTYAAGLDIVTIVWIARHFREEQRLRQNLDSKWNGARSLKEKKVTSLFGIIQTPPTGIIGRRFMPGHWRKWMLLTESFAHV